MELEDLIKGISFLPTPRWFWKILSRVYHFYQHLDGFGKFFFSSKKMQPKIILNTFREISVNISQKILKKTVN